MFSKKLVFKILTLLFISTTFIPLTFSSYDPEVIIVFDNRGSLPAEEGCEFNLKENGLSYPYKIGDLRATIAKAYGAETKSIIIKDENDEDLNNDAVVSDDSYIMVSRVEIPSKLEVGFTEKTMPGKKPTPEKIFFKFQ